MTAPYWSDGQVTLYLGDCREILPGLPADSVDAIVTDPPYDLTSGKKGGTGEASLNVNSPAGRSRISTGGGFMGKDWDATGVAFDPATWAEALRALKPGGHLLAFGGTRTYHRMVCAIEDAGFEIRDSIHWMYGSGFPKSLDVGKSIDLAGGTSPETQARVLRDARERSGLSREQVAEAVGCTVSSVRDWEEGRRRAIGREIEHLVPTPNYRTRLADLLGYTTDERQIVGVGGGSRSLYESGHRGVAYGAPATEDAVRWSGWGTALKPSHEPIVVARKPLAGTVAANVLQYGTGALNIAACRVEHDGRGIWGNHGQTPENHKTEPGSNGTTLGAGWHQPGSHRDPSGRWPTNIVFTHSATCEVIGTRQVKGDTRSGQEPGDRPGGFGDVGAASGSERPNGVLHGAQAVDVWRCAPDCPVGELDRQSGVSTSTGGSGTASMRSRAVNVYGGKLDQDVPGAHLGGLGDTGGASRFFPTFRYQAKAPAHERPRLADGTAHSTVKPVSLMRWMAKLVCPPGGTILDLFAGTGTTAEACIVEGFHSVLIEQDPKSCELIRTRLRKDIQPDLFGTAS